MNRIQLIPGIGTDVKDFAAQLVSTFAAKNGQHQCVVVGDFNGIMLKCDNNETTVEEIVNVFNAEVERLSEEYSNSPEGRRAAREAAERHIVLRGKARELMNSLETLDFNDLAAVLRWFEAMQAPSDHVDVEIDTERLINTFIAHGFQVNANVGDDCKNEKEEFAHYIVGQCLSYLQSFGGIHGLIHHFIKEWMQMYND